MEHLHLVKAILAAVYEGGDPRAFPGREVELLSMLRASFAEETIVMHAEPGWLKPQHLDLFFPDRALAIEVQGGQHIGSKNQWGGPEALITQRERDVRKWEICHRWGVRILYVLTGYDYRPVEAEVRRLFHEPGAVPTKSIGPTGDRRSGFGRF